MKQSFLATIAFALLALWGVFVANLVAFLISGSLFHQVGAVLALIAVGVSYGAQAFFTRSAAWSQHEADAVHGTLLGRYDDRAAERAESAEKAGRALQLVAILWAVLSGLCFIVGGK